MNTEYEVNKKFAEDVDAIVNNTRFVEFNPLREQEIKISSVVVTRTNDEGEHVPPPGGEADAIRCVKLSPVLQLLTEVSYLILGDHYFWTHADEIKKNAAIHRALMTINVEKSKEGKIVLKKRKPTIQEFPATVAHFGAYNECLLDMREALKTSAKQFAENQKPRA
jgi:hypothetical protein